MAADDVADVCMVVEGTYPFVQGGVSTWIHNLISALPDKSFRILHIGSAPNDRYEQKYPLPDNLIGIDQVYVQDFRPSKLQGGGRCPGNKAEAWEIIGRFHDLLPESSGVPLFDELMAVVGDPQTRALDMHDLFFSEEAWQQIRLRYQKRGNDTSFVDFFWTWRFTHIALFQMMQQEFPLARVYHTACTGYAGFLASVAKKRLRVPMIVTEHGIYTRERKLEIAQAEWIYVQETQDFKIRREQGFFKQWWIDLFSMMSRVCYQQADQIITITGVNQPFQLEDGADPAKMSVIPNGIRIDRFAPLQEMPRPEDEFMVGFVGRVVPIKDVKTFIRAVKMAVPLVPDLKAYIIGPTDEDPEYFEECERLVRLLELEEHVVYTGRVNVLEYYGRMHLLVLTSISEGQPLVILEGNCAGVPVVASNVGACEELLTGRTPEDRALGPSGIVTAVASPQETAQAIARIANDRELLAQMKRSGIERVERFYREEDLNQTYRGIYDELARQNPRGPRRAGPVSAAR